MTASEIELEIAEITIALSHIRRAGQKYKLVTGSSERDVTMADYDSLVTDRNNLQSQLDDINGLGGCVLSAGW